MTDASAAVLEVRSVSKSFGGLRAVDGVSFTLGVGEILGVAGPNGSGKSTLFNLITGIPYAPDAGEVHFDGERVDRVPPHALYRRGLSRTFQKDAEFPDLSARETVEIGGAFGGGLRTGELAHAIDRALDEVGFDERRRDTPTGELSVYQKKQLMIASALVVAPKVLLLDEPASGLTRPEIAELDELLLAVNRKGIAVLLIEHVLSLLLSVSQRLLVLDHGEMLAEGEPHAVVRRPEVIEAYLGSRP